MKHRKYLTIVGAIAVYGVATGTVLGALYVKASEQSSPPAAFWVVYLSLGLFPALAALMLRENVGITLAGVAGSLAIELITLHLVTDCFVAHNCMGTTLFSTAVPFVYFYFIVSMPISLLIFPLAPRLGPSQ